MNGYLFHVDQPLHMTMTGKFASPSPDWIHLSRVLMDYELFVQTKGVLYIADEEEQYVLEEGDFLLMPPAPGSMGIAPPIAVSIGCILFRLAVEPMSRSWIRPSMYIRPEASLFPAKEHCAAQIK